MRRPTWRQSGYENVLTPGYALTDEPNAQFFVTERRTAESMTEDWPPASTYFQHQPGSAQAQAVRRPAGDPTPNALGVR